MAGLQINAADGDLPDHLRAATQEAHRRLEDELDLLGPSPSRRRFMILLQRFYGFHASWEPAVFARPELARLASGRRRLPQLTTDLAAMGMAASEIAALPACPAAVRLGVSFDAALGSLYVMEGSTLGGKVISRALRAADWLPPAGLTYFDPYGAEAGAMWRAFRQVLREPAAPLDRRAVTVAAVETFELLRAWLTVGPGLTPPGAAASPVRPAS